MTSHAGSARPVHTPHAATSPSCDNTQTSNADWAWIRKIPLKNWDVDKLFKAFCCPVHCKDNHPLWECNYLLRFFNITLKPGVQLPQAWKCAKCVIPPNKANHKRQPYTHPIPSQAIDPPPVPSYISAVPPPYPMFHHPGSNPPSISSQGTARQVSHQGTHVPHLPYVYPAYLPMYPPQASEDASNGGFAYDGLSELRSAADNNTSNSTSNT
mmetsp:Transcript_14187/g.20768  ORF Transcript_14187/g.20768 Transcript_14187/m.20768 type:complete len:212 (+) Transcript_14187:1697-2332(+)